MKKRPLVAVLVVAIAFLPVWQARVLADAAGVKKLTLNEEAHIAAWELVQEENRLPMPCRWSGEMPPEAGFYHPDFVLPDPPGKLRGHRSSPVDLTAYASGDLLNTFPMRIGGYPQELWPADANWELHTLEQPVEVTMVNAYCQHVDAVLAEGTVVAMDPDTGRILFVISCANRVARGAARPIYTAEVVEERQPPTELEEMLLQPEPEPLVSPPPVTETEIDEDDGGISPWWGLLGLAVLPFFFGGDDEPECVVLVDGEPKPCFGSGSRPK